MNRSLQTSYRILEEAENIRSPSSEDNSDSNSINLNNDKKLMIQDKGKESRTLIEDETHETNIKTKSDFKEERESSKVSHVPLTSTKSFKEFENVEMMNATNPLKMMERSSGEVDIAHSMSRSSKAIDDLIDFKPPVLPKMTKPGFTPMSFKRDAIDPLEYEKLKNKKEPEPMVIIPELTPNKYAENLKKEMKSKHDKEDLERKPLIMVEPEHKIQFTEEDDQKSNIKKSDLDIIVENVAENEELSEIKSTDDGERFKIMNACANGEWANVEVLLRSYTKDNPLPKFENLETGETPLMLACKDNRLVIVDRLLEMGANVNDTAKDGQTALHFAAKFASEEVVKLLLSKKADPSIPGTAAKCLPIHLSCTRTNSASGILSSLLKVTRNPRHQMDKDGSIALMYAVESGSLSSIKELLKSEREFQINLKKKHSGDTVIHIACRKKDIESLRLLCELDAPIDTQNAVGQTALHICAEENDEIILKYLYTNKANAHILDYMDRSALHMAAERGHTKIVEFLIDKFKCNVLTRDKEGNTLMHVTSNSGHPETTMAFLRRGVPLHMPNKTGSVCLHAAAQSGHVNVVRALLDKGANVNARTKDLYTPLHIAVKYCHPSVVETLLGYGAQVNVKGGLLDESPLHIAAMMKGGEKCAEMLLKSGANVNDEMKKGETALHIAARTGNLEILKSLLNEGANPTLTCNEGNSSLHIAVRYCHFPIVQELLNYVNQTKTRTDVTLLVNLPNNEGETAIHLGAELEKKRAHSNFEDTDIIKLLLEYDGDMKIQTKFTEETPLHYCATAGNSDILLEIVNFLEYKIHHSVNKQAKNGWSPLLFASYNGHHDIASILLKNNARVDVFDEHGMTALHLAAERGHILVAKVLLSHKSFVNAKSKGGLTPLHLAAQNGYKELVVMLVTEHKATIDALTLTRKTPLHLAAQYGKKLVCQSLLYDKNFPADPNATDSKGQTPLHLAARNDHMEVVRLFLRFRPELLLKANYDIDGMTCGHIAAANGSLSVIKEFMRFNKSIIHGLKNKSTGSTALHLAAEGGHDKLVKVLLDAGANPSEENNDGMTCLHLAAKYGHIHLLQCLKHKINLRVVSMKSGMTPLHVAAHYGQIEFVREMLGDVPANIKSERPKTGEQMKDVLTESGLTPLHLAAQSGHENLVRLFLNCYGVDVGAPTMNNGTIPLHFAAQNGHLNVTSLLLSKSALQITKSDFKGRTALHFAASHGHLEMAELFIGQGAEINATDNAGFTPLHYAAKSGYLRVCKLLVDSGAICEAETSDFKTPLILATHFNHTEVVSYLLRNNHSTENLLENDKFLFDLMICGKLNDFKSIEEFVLLSPAPVETAAKLSDKYNELSEKEKERSKDLVDMAEHSESMCSDLVALAAVECGADTLLTALDSRGIQFLDILIETEQKEVISHPSIQRYLSDVWMGNLKWPFSKFFCMFCVFLIFPLSWLMAMFPCSRYIFQSPVIKFVLCLISHIYLTFLLMFVSIFDTFPCYRTTSLPSWYEWLLLICLSGQLVSELINPIDRKSIAILKYGILLFAFAAVFVHLYSPMTQDKNLSELIYIRNQLLSASTFMCLVVTLDFLSIHHLFGPWTIIIRDLMTDLFRFLVILFIFLFSFAVLLYASYQPTIQTDTSALNVFQKLLILYFSLFGQGHQNDLPLLANTPSYSAPLSRSVFGVSLMITIIVLINLLIAMMTDTYENIQEESDKEWKYGRAKLISNIKKTNPIPSPFILISQFVLYSMKLHYKIRNQPMPKYSDDRKQMLPKTENQQENIESVKSENLIESVIDWPVIVRRYLAIRSMGADAESQNLEDGFDKT